MKDKFCLSRDFFIFLVISVLVGSILLMSGKANKTRLSYNSRAAGLSPTPILQCGPNAICSSSCKAPYLLGTQAKKGQKIACGIKIKLAENVYIPLSYCCYNSAIPTPTPVKSNHIRIEIVVKKAALDKIVLQEPLLERLHFYASCGTFESGTFAQETSSTFLVPKNPSYDLKMFMVVEENKFINICKNRPITCSFSGSGTSLCPKTFKQVITNCQISPYINVINTLDFSPGCG